MNYTVPDAAQLRQTYADRSNADSAKWSTIDALRGSGLAGLAVLGGYAAGASPRTIANLAQTGSALEGLAGAGTSAYENILTTRPAGTPTSPRSPSPAISSPVVDFPLAGSTEELLQRTRKSPAGEVAGAVAPTTDAMSTAGSGFYIPRNPDGRPIPLLERAVPGVGNVPLPLVEADSPLHTVLGGRLGKDGRTVYRQSATFPGGPPWPPLDGGGVPWGRVDWTDHSYATDPHPDPHIHDFIYDPVQRAWREERNPRPFFGH